LNFWVDLKNSLAYGNASSYDEYRHTVGVIEGVEWAKECLKHIVKQRIYEEEDID
jgi:hypothetical protein